MANPFNIRVRVAMKKVARMRRSGDRWKERRPNEPSRSGNLGKPKRVSKAGLRGCKHELRPLSSTSHEKKNGSLTAEVILPDDAMQPRTVCLWLVMQAVI